MVVHISILLVDVMLKEHPLVQFWGSREPCNLSSKARARKWDMFPLESLSGLGLESSFERVFVSIICWSSQVKMSNNQLLNILAPISGS